MTRRRVRVAAYVIRHRVVPELLVFDHVGIPEAGTQVPAGGADPGEGLEEAVLREVAEETGLLTATVVQQVAVEDKPHPATGQPRRTSFFHLQAPPDTPDAWDHHHDRRRALHRLGVCRPGSVRTSPRSFELPQATVFHCAPDGSELVCLRTPDLLARQPDVRIGIAPDVDLLVHDGTLTGWSLTGWSLTDPARYLTDAFTTPDLATAPSATTRHHLAECLRLISEPVIDAVTDQETDAWRDLLALQRALHTQQEDRRRVDVLQSLIDRLVEDNE